MTTAPSVPSAEALRRWGEVAAAAAFGGGVLVVGLLMWTAPEFLPLVPLAVVAGGVLSVLFRRPRLNFIIWLAGLPLILSSEEGIQLHEALYGLYFFAYLAHWYGRRLLLYRSQLVWGAEDVAAALLLVLGFTLGTGLGLAFGAPLVGLRGDVLSFAMLLLYFPVKDFCVRDRNGPLVVFALVVFAAMVISIDNALLSERAIASAEEVWDVVNVRIVGRELILVATGLLLLAVLAVLRKRWLTLTLMALLGIVLGGLILTKARAYWAAFMLGVGVLALLARGASRRRLLARAALGAGVVILAAIVVFGPYLALVAAGFIDRFFQLSGSHDISMEGRYVEAAAALQHIRLNPILGHGLGTVFSYFSIILLHTAWKSYIHIGYIAVWFKFGLWGLALYGVLWLRSLALTFRASGARTLSPIERALALGITATLTCIALPAFTVNLFFEDDTLATFAILTALGSALYYRSRGEGPAMQRPGVEAKAA